METSFTPDIVRLCNCHCVLTEYVSMLWAGRETAYWLWVVIYKFESLFAVDWEPLSVFLFWNKNAWAVGKRSAQRKSQRLISNKYFKIHEYIVLFGQNSEICALTESSAAQCSRVVSLLPFLLFVLYGFTSTLPAVYQSK